MDSFEFNSPIVFGIKIDKKINTNKKFNIVCHYSDLAKAWILGKENLPDVLIINELTDSERDELAKKLTDFIDRSVNPSEIECWLLRSISTFYGHCIDGCETPYKIGWKCIAPKWCKDECIKECGYSHIWGQLIPCEQLKPGQSTLPFKNKMPKCWKDAKLSVISSDDPPWRSEFALVGGYGYEYEDGKFDFNDLPTTSKKVADALMLPESDIDMYWSYSPEY